MIVARRNGHHIDRLARNVGLARPVVAPADDGAVGFERQTMVAPPARRNGY